MKKKRERGPDAERVDPLDLYVRSVQSPEHDVDFLTAIYKRHLGGTPKRLREDFCGTGAMAAAWVRRGRGREAWGVDFHAPTLAWGERRFRKKLSARMRERLHLVEADVRSVDVPPVDVLCAQNFSYYVFKQRSELLRYFELGLDGLADEGGVFVVDAFGGYASIEDEREDVTDYGDFHYVWEQHRFDPINGFGTYKIHFRFPDGSALEDAFVYDWRMWTLPEIRDAMREVGFDDVVTYWEEEDPDTGEGTGTFAPRSSANCDPAWNAYVVGVRRPR